MTEIVDIICSVLNGERYLDQFLDSLSTQTHADWRLWVRDDGSSDRSMEIVVARAAADSRVRILHVGGPRLGIAGAYGWLLERAPRDAHVIMTADVDDVWLPHKIERTLDAMRRAESGWGSATPILVHTDLTVVDERLDVVHHSYWAHSALAPEPATLRRQIVRNLVAAPTLMMNAALREAIGATPAAALYQDWWYGLVALVTGRIVTVREPTVLYRQHGGNSVGARDPRVELGALLSTVANAFRGTPEFRRDLERLAGQAQALLDRYGDRLSASDRALVSGISTLPRRPFIGRKLDTLRYRVLPEEGLLRTIGILLRA